MVDSDVKRYQLELLILKKNCLNLKLKSGCSFTYYLLIKSVPSLFICLDSIGVESLLPFVPPYHLFTDSLTHTVAHTLILIFQYSHFAMVNHIQDTILQIYKIM